MKKQSVITHRYLTIYETQKTFSILDIPKFKQVMVLRRYKIKQFLCGQNILTEALFVTQLSSYMGISGRRIVWIKSVVYHNHIIIQFY
jgi:hypothetical protein